jgi:predicted RNA-binding Zn-ribbon protein involved in translation (DUF1610 family)
MLFGNLSIDAFVCLSCGEIVAPDSFIVRKIIELPVAEDMKVKGQLFSTIACPKCEEGFVFGFLAIPKELRDPIPMGPTTVKDSGADIIEISEEESAETERQAIEEAKKATKKKKRKRGRPKKGLAKSEDGTIDLDAPPPVVRETTIMRQCSICKKEIEVPGSTSSDFNVRCPSCLKSLINSRRG